MKVSDFDFNLPQDLIARFPAAQRSASRLLCLDRRSGQVEHRQFPDLLSLLQPNDLLIFNNTKVMAARLLGRKASGGKVELLVERVLEQGQALAMIKASKSPKPGTDIVLENGCQLLVAERQGELYRVQLQGPVSWFDVFEQVGRMPIPPYMERQDEDLDRSRYQTIYADREGAVAAPTAGLHFDDQIMQELQSRGIGIGFVTLHVGLGTFLPMRVDEVQSHTMHSEWMELSEDLAQRINRTKSNGGRVIAVGTTSVRSLETAARQGRVAAYCGETDIFIYPGYEFQLVDAMLTNFHLPKSTLIMLVSAFSGWDNIRAAYEEAIAARYRFFSYGDAMFIS